MNIQDREFRVAEFGDVVLEVLETSVDWDSEMLDRLADEARNRGLATTDEEGYFKRTDI